MRQLLGFLKSLKKESVKAKPKSIKIIIPHSLLEWRGRKKSLTHSFVKDGVTGSTPHQNKELEPTVPLFSCIADTPTVEVVDQKGRNVEVNSLNLEALVEINKHRQGLPITELASVFIVWSCQDQIQGAGFVPSVLDEENKTDVAKGHTAVADEPNKRSNDGKSNKD